MSEATAHLGARLGPGSLRMFSDDRLVRRATTGDERAFAAIYGRYHQRLYRYCLAIVGDAQDAQDALQGTMLKAMKALPGEQRQIELKPWLYRIAHNESVDLVRRRRRTEQIDPELMALEAQPPEETEQRERLRRLITDMEELPNRQRAALVMRELAGLSFEEIGSAVGTSPAVARQTLYEARLGLREMEAGREMSCDAVTRALSDADGRVTRRRDVRAHLRGCQSCRDFRAELNHRKSDFASLAPLPAVAAAGLLQGVLGGHGSSGGGLVGALGGGAGKALGTSVAVKSAATVAVVAAIGVTAADRGGLIDAGLPGGSGGGTNSRSHAPAPPGPSGAKTAPDAGPGGRAASEGRSTSVDGRLGVQPAATAKQKGAKSAESQPSAPGRSARGRGHGEGRGEPSPPSAHGPRTAAKRGGAKAGPVRGQAAKSPHLSKHAHSSKPSHSTGGGSGAGRLRGHASRAESRSASGAASESLPATPAKANDHTGG
jgi:RNA polymerase sigma factor (sigma-70 family)